MGSPDQDDALWSPLRGIRRRDGRPRTSPAVGFAGMTPVAVTAVDPGAFLAIVATAAVAGTVSVLLTGARADGPHGRRRADARRPDRPQVLGSHVASSSSSSPASASGCCSSSPATRSTWSASRGAAAAGRARWALSLALAYTSAASSPPPASSLVPLHRLGARDDGDRHAHPDPVGQRRAEDALRHLPARRRRGRRVRPDPARHAVLSTAAPLHEAAILIAFVALAVAVALLSVRSSGAAGRPRADARAS